MSSTKWETDAIEKVIERVRWKTAVFRRICCNDPKDKLPATEAEVDAFVRERTRIYVESWIVPLLEAVRDGDRETAEALTR